MLLAVAMATQWCRAGYILLYKLHQMGTWWVRAAGGLSPQTSSALQVKSCPDEEGGGGGWAFIFLTQPRGTTLLLPSRIPMSKGKKSQEHGMGRGQGWKMSMERDGLSVIVGMWPLDWDGVNVAIGMRQLGCGSSNAVAVMWWLGWDCLNVAFGIQQLDWNVLNMAFRIQQLNRDVLNEALGIWQLGSGSLNAAIGLWQLASGGLKMDTGMWPLGPERGMHIHPPSTTLHPAVVAPGIPTRCAGDLSRGCIPYLVVFHFQG